LLVARADTEELTCAGVDISASALELDVAGNSALGSMNTTWFINYAGGDFHLSGTHPAAINTAATWTTGDPATDIDGDPRPLTDGSPDFAGADVP
jgi:hypothetical protein